MCCISDVTFPLSGIPLSPMRKIYVQRDSSSTSSKLYFFHVMRTFPAESIQRALATPFPTFPLPFHSLPSSHANVPSCWSFWLFFSCPHPTWRPSLFFLLIYLGFTHFHGPGCCPFSVSSILIFLDPTSPVTDSQPCSWNKESAITVSSTRPIHSSTCSGLLLLPFLWNYSVIKLMAKSRFVFSILVLFDLHSV